MHLNHQSEILILFGLTQTIKSKKKRRMLVVALDNIFYEMYNSVNSSPDLPVPHKGKKKKEKKGLLGSAHT